MCVLTCQHTRELTQSMPLPRIPTAGRMGAIMGSNILSKIAKLKRYFVTQLTISSSQERTTAESRTLLPT